MTDYQAKQRQRNMIVGSFVIIALCAFFYMLFRFRDLPQVVSKFNSFEILVYFPEAPGVQKDTPVQYCGYQIGRVVKVAPPQMRGGSHKVGVHIAIDDRFADIPEQVDIFLMKRGLGSSFVELRDVSSGMTQSGSFLKNGIVKEDGQVGMASDFFPPEVQDKLEDLVDSIAALTENTNAVIGDSENQANIKKMIANIEAASSQADVTLRSIQTFSDTSSEQVQVVGDKIALAAEQLEGILSETRQLLAKIDSGSGTAGKLVNDGRLYENLIESSRELQMLLDQIKQWLAQTQEEGVRVKL
ncbi:MAG: MlaD family protein [Planctomycetota bacterium]|jgi:phospholipid/cholesterol/gamma-HCH transport system substrate-binding protein